MLRKAIILTVLCLMLLPAFMPREAKAIPTACRIMEVLGYHPMLEHLCFMQLANDSLPDYSEDGPGNSGGAEW